MNTATLVGYTEDMEWIKSLACTGRLIKLSLTFRIWTFAFMYKVTYQG